MIARIAALLDVLNAFAPQDSGFRYLPSVDGLSNFSQGPGDEHRRQLRPDCFPFSHDIGDTDACP